VFGFCVILNLISMGVAQSGSSEEERRAGASQCLSNDDLFQALMIANAVTGISHESRKLRFYSGSGV